MVVIGAHTDLTEVDEDFALQNDFAKFEQILLQKIAQSQQTQKNLDQMLAQLDSEAAQGVSGLEEVNKTITDTKAATAQIIVENAAIEKKLKVLDQEIAAQTQIYQNYSARVSSMKLEYEDSKEKIKDSQKKSLDASKRADQNLYAMTRRQRELYSLMNLQRDNHRSDYILYRMANGCENKEIRDLLIKRFFPQIKEVEEENDEAERKFNNTYSDISLLSVKKILEKARQKLVDY